MKLLLVTLLLAAAPAAALAQAGAPDPEVAGDWQGVVQTPEVSLPFVVHLGATVSGDSPSENRFGIAGKFERVGGAYRVTFVSGGVLDVKLSRPNVLEGAYSKDGLVIPLTLERKPAGK